MKLPKLKLPALTDKQNAALLTFGVVSLTILLLSLLVAYPGDTIVIGILMGITGLIVFIIRGLYKGILELLEKRR